MDRGETGLSLPEAPASPRATSDCRRRRDHRMQRIGRLGGAALDFRRDAGEGRVALTVAKRGVVQDDAEIRRADMADVLDALGQAIAIAAATQHEHHAVDRSDDRQRFDARGHRAAVDDDDLVVLTQPREQLPHRGRLQVPGRHPLSLPAGRMSRFGRAERMSDIACSGSRIASRTPGRPSIEN